MRFDRIIQLIMMDLEVECASEAAAILLGDIPIRNDAPR
jgi:hypothetical protein